jgi:hypothetical protein
MSKVSRYLFGVFCMVLVSACSHLHVDLDSSWRVSADAHVDVVVEQPPAEIAVTQVSEAIYQLGWQPPSAGHNADIQVLCRWQRVVDLNADSEPIKTVKSFHVKVINAENGQLLGVADYFYGTGEIDLWSGVESTLHELYSRITTTAKVPPAASAQIATAPVGPDTVVTPSVDETVTENDSSSEVQETVAPSTAPVNVSVPPAVSAPSLPAEPVVEPMPTATVVVPVADHGEEQSSSAVVVSSPAIVRQPEMQGTTVDDVKPQSMETSPWVPRFQGLGLENWGQDEPLSD